MSSEWDDQTLDKEPNLMTLPAWLSSGDPNFTCPSCGVSYKINAPHTLRFLCPDCLTWLCWKDVELVEIKRQGDPLCPLCGQALISRTNKKTGRSFWGCLDWKKCKGSRQAGAFSVETVSVEIGGRIALWEEFVPDEVTVEWERTDRLRDRIEARERSFGEWLTRRRKV